MTPKVVFVAISGATCSGKTTLAHTIKGIIPRSSILHQDDFAPPADQLPIHPVLKVQDWDDPPGAIMWQAQRDTIQSTRQHGRLPDSHQSHDHLNVRNEVPLSDEVRDKWIAKFAELPEDVVFVIADGFLMLYDEESVREFDVRVFVREEYEVLKKRREERHGYFTADGEMWRDPPGYWDGIVWPAYLKAHAPLFLNNDAINGDPNPDKIEGLIVLEGRKHSIDSMVEQTCAAVVDYVNAGRSAKDWRRP